MARSLITGVEMGVATEQLKKEHRAIETMVTILETVIKKLGTGEKVEPEHLTEIVDFFRVFADQCHYSKEEEIFFPALEQAGIPREDGPIGVVLQEHDPMRALMSALAQEVVRYRSGSDQGTGLK